MKVKKQCSPFLFYAIIFALFFVDLAIFSIFEKPIIYSLLCFYLLQLAKPIPIMRIILTCALFSLNSLIHYDRFGLALIYIIPATLLGIKMRHTLYDSYIQYYFLLAGCLLAQIILIELGILHLTVSIPYTISTIFANMILIWLMSYIDL